MIVVAGEALMDLLLSPDGALHAAPGGGPFNAARAMARLGAPAAFLGRLSSDRFGRLLRDQLDGDGVDLTLVVATDDPTTLAVAALDPGGSATYRFYTAGTSAAGLTADALPELPTRLDAVHVGTLGLVLEPVASALEALVGRVPDATLVMIDLNARPAAMPDRDAWADRIDRLLGRADIISASLDDLAVLRPGTEPDAAAASILARGPRVLLLTDGPRPARVVTPRGATLHTPPQLPVVDTVGAGDSFGGGFLATWVLAGRGRAELADDAALGDAVDRALMVASLNCTRRGADPPTAAELASALANR